MGSGDIQPLGGFSVLVLGQPVTIPYRIYHSEPHLGRLAGLSRTQQDILRCLYSRHHDGYVRQRAVQPLLRSNADWVVPFVVQLIGEYIVEIVEVIRDGLAGRNDLDAYARFANQNPEFIELTKQHSISYWNCYYRSRYPNVAEYPGRQAMALIGRSRSQQRTRGSPR